MKHLKKAKGYIGENIEYNDEYEVSSPNILSDKNMWGDQLATKTGQTVDWYHHNTVFNALHVLKSLYFCEEFKMGFFFVHSPIN